MQANKLRLNTPKAEVLLVGTSSLLRSGWTQRLAWVALTHNPFACSLSVLLDPHLLLHEQVTLVTRTAYIQLWLVPQLCPALNKKELSTIIHVLVRSRLD